MCSILSVSKSLYSHFVIFLTEIFLISFDTTMSIINCLLLLIIKYYYYYITPWYDLEFYWRNSIEVRIYVNILYFNHMSVKLYFYDFTQKPIILKLGHESMHLWLLLYSVNYVLFSILHVSFSNTFLKSISFVLGAGFHFFHCSLNIRIVIFLSTHSSRFQAPYFIITLPFWIWISPTYSSWNPSLLSR